MRFNLKEEFFDEVDELPEDYLVYWLHVWFNRKKYPILFGRMLLD